MVSRYEQGMLDAPLTLERIVGWALCCEALSSKAFHELLAMAGYYLPWKAADLTAFDDLLQQLPGPEPDRPDRPARAVVVARARHRALGGPGWLSWFRMRKQRRQPGGVLRLHELRGAGWPRDGCSRS